MSLSVYDDLERSPRVFRRFLPFQILPTLSVTRVLRQGVRGHNYRYVRSYSLSERALSLLCVCGWREEYERASLSLSFRGGLFSLRAYANSPVGMAPLFEAAGFAPFFQCKFRLKAFDDGKLRCYADTATGTVEVVARFHGLTMEQFNSLPPDQPRVDPHRKLIIPPSVSACTASCRELRRRWRSG